MYLLTTIKLAYQPHYSVVKGHLLPTIWRILCIIGRHTASKQRKKKYLPVRGFGVFYFVRVFFLIFFVIILLRERQRLDILVEEPRDRAQRAVARRARTVRRQPLHSWRLAHCPTKHQPKELVNIPSSGSTETKALPHKSGRVTRHIARRRSSL